MDPAVQQQMLKLMSVRLCPPTPAQAVLDMIVCPPAPSDSSFLQYQAVSRGGDRVVSGAGARRATRDRPDRSFLPLLQEKQAILADLAAKAKVTEQVFSKVPGISCNPVQGAMYSFPRMQLPPRAVQRAKVSGWEPSGRARGGAGPGQT